MEYGIPKWNYSDNTTKALSYLLPKGPGLTAITECIYRVEGEILAASPAGVLVRHVVSGEYLLSGADTASCAALLSLVPQGAPLLLHSREAAEAARCRLPEAQLTSLTLWRYPTLDPPRFPLPFEVWPLDLGDVEEALSFDPTRSPAQLSHQISQKTVFGACIDDKLEGTVGTDAGGGISYLTVSPRLRGTGVGKTLLLWMVRKELQRGHVPFLLAEDGGLAPLLSAAGLEEAAPLWRVSW